MFDYKRFDELRRERGITRSFLYGKVGLAGYDDNNVRRLKTVNPAWIEIWADLLGTTVAYLNGETDEKEKPTVEIDSELSKMYDQLTPDEQEQVKQRIRELLAGHE